MGESAGDGEGDYVCERGDCEMVSGRDDECIESVVITHAFTRDSQCSAGKDERVWQYAMRARLCSGCCDCDTMQVRMQQGRIHQACCSCVMIATLCG